MASFSVPSHGLAARVSQERRAALEHRFGALADLPAPDAAQTQDLPGQVVIVEQGQPGIDMLVEAYALRRPDAAMVVIGDDLSSRLVRALFRFDASDVLTGDASEADLEAAVTQLLAPKPEGDTFAWAFTGAVGGAGATTLAIEAAFNLANGPDAGPVCLIDLHMSGGMTMAFLDGEPKLDLRSVCADPERLDETLLRVYAWSHEKGVSVLAPPRDRNGEQTATLDGVLRLLDVALSTYGRVIIDLPRHRLPWTDPVLSAVDEAVVVSEMTVPSLHAAADLCREIDTIRGDGTPTRFVLNRMFGKKRHRNSFPIDKAERAIGRSIDNTVSSDWDAARMAVNLGLPIAQVKPRCPLVKDVDVLVRRLMGDSVSGRGETRSRTREESRRRRREAA